MEGVPRIVHSHSVTLLCDNRSLHDLLQLNLLVNNVMDRLPAHGHLIPRGGRVYPNHRGRTPLEAKCVHLYALKAVHLGTQATLSLTIMSSDLNSPTLKLLMDDLTALL